MRLLPVLSGVLVVAVGGPLAGADQGQTRWQCRVSEMTKLTASDAAANNEFGRSVSVYGDLALVGAYELQDPSAYAGAAYVYRFDGTNWNQQAKLTASDAAAGDWFGRWVALGANVAVVGAPRTDDACPSDPDCDSGSVYVYRFIGGNWIEQARLTASDATVGDLFGWSVSVSGDTALIGAYGDNHAGWGSGSAYVYRFINGNWIEQAKLTASDAAMGDFFGWSVSLDNNVAVIGAFGDDDLAVSSGAAYVFRFDGLGWIEQTKLTASDAATLDSFGQAVAVSGAVAVIGAYTDDDDGGSSGSAYVYRFDGSTWTEQAKLTASDASQGDSFGYGVAISGPTAVIGAIHDQDAGLSTGSAYVYRFDGSTWTEQAKLVASDAAAGDRFGMAVSINGDVALCGAWGNDDGGTDSGSAYLFGGLSDCNSNDTLDVCDITVGSSQDDNANGIPDECEAPIPTVSQWGLIIMALLFIAAGATIATRSRRFPV